MTHNESTQNTSRVSLKRDIGWFGSFAMGYADVGADIYVALGLVAAYAAGWAPFAFMVAAITYVATGLAYAELASAYPYAGGAQVYAMKAFNDFAGFLAGWLVMLDYTVCIALFSIATVGYLTFFMPWLTEFGLVVTILGMGLEINGMGIAAFLVVVALILVNIVGIRESSTLNSVMVTINVLVLSVIMTLGVILAFNLGLFSAQIVVRGSPVEWSHIDYIWNGNIPDQNFLYAVTLAMSSFIGIESIAQAAEETKRPGRTIPRATKLSVLAVLVFAVGLSTISLGIVEWEVLASSNGAPISVLAAGISVIGSYLLPVVSLTGFAICLVSSNTGVIGVSRVVFSMSQHGLVPGWFAKVNSSTRTPVRSIVVFGLIGATMALVGNLDWVADLYNFGALLSYLMVNVSLIVLRHTDRDSHRAWRVPYNLRIRIGSREIEIPAPALVGVVACASIWTLVILFHPMGRILGIAWTLAGVLVYTTFRISAGRALFSKEGGRSIEPLAYKLNALVLVRVEESESIIESLVKNIDRRFRLELVYIVRTDDTVLPLAAVGSEIGNAETTLRSMSKALAAAGYESKYRVEVGPFVETVKKIIVSPEVDFVILPRRSAFKKGFKKPITEDLAVLISSVARGKLMVVRK
ncbi:MAG: APC family permease [Candidatus Thorarchaeota archaeon]